MRLIDTKAGKRWRCIRSIEATKKGRLESDGVGVRDVVTDDVQTVLELLDTADAG